jgi:hypothetical protein
LRASDDEVAHDDLDALAHGAGLGDVAQLGHLQGERIVVAVE